MQSAVRAAATARDLRAALAEVREEELEREEVELDLMKASAATGYG